MKILMINVVCGIRSTGRICTDLATALETQGHEVKIAYGRETVPAQFQKYAVKIGSDWDVKLHGIKARLFDAAGFGSRAATEKFIKWVEEFNPDVIHLHNIHGYYINIKVLFDYLKKSGKKIIWTLHDCWSFTGHTAYCDAVNCERWKTGCYQCPQIKEYPKAMIDRSRQNWKKKKKIFTGVPNMIIVTPSHWLANLMKKSFLKDYTVKVIHNGIDTSKFKPLENDFKEYFGIQDKFILVGVTTAWDENKGFSDYLRLAEILDDRYRIVLIGITEKQREYLPDNILGIPRTNSVKELAQIYSAADYVLNLSKTENYPTVNLEAMCCGMPIITYDVGGSKESIKPARRIVVEKGNVQAIADTVNSQEAVCHVNISDFDKEQTTNQYIHMTEKYGYWKTKSRFNLIGKYVILGVAAIWDSRKGLQDLILLSKMLSDDYRIIIIGVREEQKKQLPNNIIGIMHTNDIQELSEFYAIADLFVNPTIEDNYPTTNLEAISCGTPIITYDTGGSPESAKMFGMSVPKKDIQGVVDAIDNMKKVKQEQINVDYRYTVLEYIELYKKAMIVECS